MKPAAPASLATKKASKGPKVKLPRTATPAGAIRRSDLAKVKADARKGVGTPMSRAGQRAIARSAREAPLQRKQAIAAAKRKGRTGFGKGPKMNAGAIGNRDFNWNRNEQPATAQERLAMWRKSERRMIRNTPSDAGKRGYYGALRASRRAAELVDLGNRRGNLPTTRKMAEEPRQRRSDRISRNETQGRLASSEASRRLLPQIQKVRDAAQKRIAEGKKPTAAQKEKEQKLVGEYNKAVRKLQVAEAAKSYMQNPYGFKAQRMSEAVKPAKPPTRTKGSRTTLPRTPGTIAKPKGLKPGALAARRMAKPGLSGGPQANRKSQLLAGAQKRMTQANRIDAKIASLEKQYRSKDSAFYTQGVKTAERDRMHAKSRQAADLREQSAALRQKAANATKMAGKIKDKPKVKISSDKRVARAQINEANARSRPTTWKRRMAKSTAVRAQMFYANPMGFKHGNPFGKGWRVPRPFRGKL
jgi:hypothetical protein